MLQHRIIKAEDRLDLDDIAAVRRRLIDETGGGYGSFCRSLHPRYGLVLRDIAAGYAGLVASLCVAGLAKGWFVAPAIMVAALGAGFAIAYIQLFLHEAAHVNLSADRRTNDRLADALISWQIGSTIAAYRRTHSGHHRLLGTTTDTEASYQNPLSWRFLMSLLTGRHALSTMLTRQGDGGTGGASGGIRGGLIHLLILAVLVAFGAWPAAAAWVLGMAVVFPLFGALRPMLEHRPLDRERGGSGNLAVTRLFDDGPIARLFGGAGFNRHLLHHFEPQISCTRLADFEAYLMRSSIAAELDARRTGYASVLRQLWSERARG